MPRLSATPGVLGAAIAAAAAAWWLPAAWLQAGSGFAGLPDLAARAAVYLLLAQAVLVPLFAAGWSPERDRRTAGSSGAPGGRPDSRGAAVIDDAAAALSALAPSWPLLALLWLTSHLSWLTLAAGQLLIALSSALLGLLGRALARKGQAAGSESWRAAAGLAAAAAAWMLRDALHAWIVPA